MSCGQCVCVCIVDRMRDRLKDKQRNKWGRCSKNADGENKAKRQSSEKGRNMGETRHDINRGREGGRGYGCTQRQKIVVAVSQGSCETEFKNLLMKTSVAF